MHKNEIRRPSVTEYGADDRKGFRSNCNELSAAFIHFSRTSMSVTGNAVHCNNAYRMKWANFTKFKIEAPRFLEKTVTHYVTKTTKHSDYYIHHLL
jgi:hypothetical protein